MKNQAQQVAELKELVKQFQADMNAPKKARDEAAEHSMQVDRAMHWMKNAAREQKETPPRKRDAARKHRPHIWRGQGDTNFAKMIFSPNTGTIVRADDFKGFTDSPQRGCDNPGGGRHGGTPIRRP